MLVDIHSQLHGYLKIFRDKLLLLQLKNYSLYLNESIHTLRIWALWKCVQQMQIKSPLNDLLAVVLVGEFFIRSPSYRNPPLQ